MYFLILSFPPKNVFNHHPSPFRYESKAPGHSTTDTIENNLDISIDRIKKKKRRLFDKTTQVLDSQEFTTEVISMCKRISIEKCSYYIYTALF